MGHARPVKYYIAKNMGDGMGDGLLTLMNTIRLNDMATASSNRDAQYDLDHRADRIARKTGERPMDWDEFAQQSPATAPISNTQHIFGHAVGGALVFAAVMGIYAAIATTGGLAAIGASIAMGGGIGAAIGAFVGVLDDQKPEIRQKQLANYKDYLDDFEKTHAPGKAPQMQQEAGAPDNKWRDQVDQSRQAEQAATR